MVEAEDIIVAGSSEPERGWGSPAVVATLLAMFVAWAFFGSEQTDELRVELDHQRDEKVAERVQKEVALGDNAKLRTEAAQGVIIREHLERKLTDSEVGRAADSRSAQAVIAERTKERDEARAERDSVQSAKRASDATIRALKEQVEASEVMFPKWFDREALPPSDSPKAGEKKGWKNPFKKKAKTPERTGAQEQG